MSPLITVIVAIAAAVAIVVVVLQISGAPVKSWLTGSPLPSGGTTAPGSSAAGTSPGHGSPARTSSGPGARHSSSPGASRGSHRPAPGHSHSSAPTSPGPTTGPWPAHSLAPSRGVLFGAWAEPYGGVSVEGAVLRLEHQIGRKLAIDQLYVPWSHAFPMPAITWDLNNGRLPMITWAGANTHLVATGAYDSVFRARARELRGLHRPVMLRWFAEMDGTPDLPLVRSPSSFVAAWRHVHNIFAQVGATNVIWVWCPNASKFNGGVAQRYYPGGNYVDWIGGDGYNWAPQRPNAQWRSFAAIFSGMYAWGRRTGKPMLVGEYGVLESRPGQKAAWISQAASQLRTMFPDIKAVVYFNSDHQGFDWRVTTSASALAAFRTFAEEAYFRATVPR